MTSTGLFIIHSFDAAAAVVLSFFLSSCSCGYCSRVYCLVLCQATSIGGPDPSFTPWLWWVPINFLWVGLFHVIEFWLELIKQRWLFKNGHQIICPLMEVESRGDGT